MQRILHKNESGNILVYILGAIFLLGILIVTTKGNYQPGTGIDSEAVTIKTSEVRRYANELERGVRFALQNGVSETDLRFAHPNAASAYGTYGSNPKAEIFNPLGGGVDWRDPPAGIQVASAPWYFTAANDVKGVGSTCTQNSCADLIALLPNVTEAFCKEANHSNGIVNPSDAPPVEVGGFNAGGNMFAGTITYVQTLNTAGDITTSRTEGCIEGSNASANNGLADTYYYYKVLIAR